MTQFRGARPAPLDWVPKLVLGVVLLVSTSCATSPVQERMEALRSSVKEYNEAYRWKNYQRAAVFLPMDQRAAFVASYEEDDKALHVEGYQILAVNFASPEVADVKVRYRFMQLPSVTLERRIVTQHWARVSGQWTLEHENDSIREIDPELAKTFDPNGFGGPLPEDEAPTLEVEVLDAEGKVVKRRNLNPSGEEEGAPKL